jgi:hypothetical protein
MESNVESKPAKCLQQKNWRRGRDSNPAVFRTVLLPRDGENPCKHSQFNTVSFPSYLSNDARFNSISVFWELMELMHPFLFRWNLYAADAAACDAPRALHNIGTMPENSAHLAESLL